MNKLRLSMAIAGLAALMATGCVLISGQFVVTAAFSTFGLDPVTVDSPTTLAGVPVDLNEVSEYADHKDELKGVVDLALVGTVTNLTANPTSVEVWMVANPGAPLTTETAVKSAGTKVWGSLPVPGNGSVKVDWNKSAGLFVGRQALVSEIKGDGRFDLYAIGTGAYAFRMDKGALIAVVSAGK